MSSSAPRLAGSLLAARSLSFAYDGVPVLQSCDLRIERGDSVVVMGPSGSGKSTLLHCLAGVLSPTGGQVWFDGSRLDSISDSRRSDLRLARMGAVFQTGVVIPNLSLIENVMMPLLLLGRRRAAARGAALAALDELGVADVADRPAGAVSAGQSQRGALARAIVHEPDIVFADEPTSALDTVSAEQVLDVLIGLSERRGMALLVVTHDHQVASHFDRLATFRGGALEEQVSPARTNAVRRPMHRPVPKGEEGGRCQARPLRPWKR